MTLPRRRQRTRTKPVSARIRCPGHLAWVRGFECCVRGARMDGGLIHVCDGDIQAAHVRMGTDGAMGRKPGDNWAVPLCDGAHKQQHNIGEPRFWAMHEVDPHRLAAELWAKSPARVRYEIKRREG